MKIAVPSRNNMVDSHFGHCEYYTIVEINADNTIKKSEILKAPHSCGCKSDIAFTLKNLGVELMLAGNMGQGAVNKITGTGMRVIRGCEGEVNAVVENYLKGQLSDSGLTCSHHDHEDDHEHGHNCNHH